MHRPDACAHNLKKVKVPRRKIPTQRSADKALRTNRLLLPSIQKWYRFLYVLFTTCLKFVPYTTVLNDIEILYGLLGMCTSSSIDRSSYLEKAIQTFNKSEDWIACAFLSFGIYKELLNQNKKQGARKIFGCHKTKLPWSYSWKSLEKSIGLAVYYEKRKIYHFKKGLQTKNALYFEELYSQHRRDYANAKNKTYLSKIQDEFFSKKSNVNPKPWKNKVRSIETFCFWVLSLLSLWSFSLFINNRNKQKIKRQKTS